MVFTNKEKNGFTLVELLAVIVVMAIIAAIGYASVSSVLGTSKDELYKQQVSQLIKAAKQWSIENIDQLPTSQTDSFSVTVQQLKEAGNISAFPEDPRNGNIMDGQINISCSNSSCNDYNYEYQE